VRLLAGAYPSRRVPHPVQARPHYGQRCAYTPPAALWAGAGTCVIGPRSPDPEGQVVGGCPSGFRGTSGERGCLLSYCFSSFSRCACPMVGLAGGLLMVAGTPVARMSCSTPRPSLRGPMTSIVLMGRPSEVK